jgi:hypothetical protein
MVRDWYYMDTNELLLYVESLEATLRVAEGALEFYGHQDHYVIEGEGSFGEERLLVVSPSR